MKFYVLPYVTVFLLTSIIASAHTGSLDENPASVSCSVRYPSQEMGTVIAEFVLDKSGIVFDEKFSFNGEDFKIRVFDEEILLTRITENREVISARANRLVVLSFISASAPFGPDQMPVLCYRKDLGLE